MQLVFVSAHQPAHQEDTDVSLGRAALRGSIRGALDGANVPGEINVSFLAGEMTASVYTPDADAAFAVLGPVFRASAACANGYVLLRYGEPGAPERQVHLGAPSDSNASAL